MVTVNSDDPAYFGGYVADNFRRVSETFDLGPATLSMLAANSIEASFLDSPSKAAHLDRLETLGAEIPGT